MTFYFKTNNSSEYPADPGSNYGFYSHSRDKRRANVANCIMVVSESVYSKH